MNNWLTVGLEDWIKLAYIKRIMTRKRKYFGQVNGHNYRERTWRREWFLEAGKRLIRVKDVIHVLLHILASFDTAAVWCTWG